MKLSQPMPDTSVTSFMTSAPKDSAFFGRGANVLYSNIGKPSSRSTRNLFHDPATGSLSHFNHRIGTIGHCRIWYIFQLPLKQLRIELFCLLWIRGIQFHVYERICHTVLLLTDRHLGVGPLSLSQYSMRKGRRRDVAMGDEGADASTNSFSGYF